jgi:hypothetical protein
MQFVRLEWQVTATRPFLNHTALHAASRVTNLCVCKRSCAVASLSWRVENPSIFRRFVGRRAVTIGHAMSRVFCFVSSTWFEDSTRCLWSV